MVLEIVVSLAFDSLAGVILSELDSVKKQVREIDEKVDAIVFAEMHAAGRALREAAELPAGASRSDGPGAEGRLVRDLEVRTPGGGVLERVRASLRTPMPVWAARRVAVPPACPVSTLVVVHTLPHMEIPGQSARPAGVATATEQAVRICRDDPAVSIVGIPLRTGGFRLPALQALSAMLVGLHGVPSPARGCRLTLLIAVGGRHAPHLTALLDLGNSMGFDLMEAAPPSPTLPKLLLERR